MFGYAGKGGPAIRQKSAGSFRPSHVLSMVRVSFSNPVIAEVKGSFLPIHLKGC